MIVDASGAVALRRGASGEAALKISVRKGASFSYRLRLKRTSSVVSARPFTGGLLCHLTPGRSFSVICRPSPANSKDWAASP